MCADSDLKKERKPKRQPPNPFRRSSFHNLDTKSLVLFFIKLFLTQILSQSPPQNSVLALHKTLPPTPQTSKQTNSVPKIPQTTENSPILIRNSQNSHPGSLPSLSLFSLTHTILQNLCTKRVQDIR
jgi:hypothetical protein